MNEKQCIVCGKILEYSKYSRKNKKYCSRECIANQMKKKSEQFWEKKEEEYMKNPKYCDFCSKILPLGFDIKARKFCSKSCRAKSRNSSRSQESFQKQRETLMKTLEIKKKSKKNTKPTKSDIAGPYTRVFSNICQKTGKIFYSPSYRKYHPNLMIDYQSYYESCKFRFSISQFPEWFDGDIISKYGWYSTPGKCKNGITNKDGVSRDHLIAISYGWKNDIPPEIIRHPANCRLITHKDNQKKKDKCLVTLDELKTLIDYFETKYPEYRA